jgi:choline dehydrogenase
MHRILFDGKPATGVEFSRGGRIDRAYAREVILSAGAIGSPHILQLLGVGDPEHLGKIGVSVLHESCGVGKNMQDHYTARVSYPVVGAQTANERSRGLPLAGEVMRWLFAGKGMLTYSARTAQPSYMHYSNKQSKIKKHNHVVRFARLYLVSPI